jgi:hypothetical protein
MEENQMEEVLEEVQPQEEELVEAEEDHLRHKNEIKL